MFSKAREGRRRDGEGGGWSPRKLSHMASGSDKGVGAQLLQEAPGDRPCTEVGQPEPTTSLPAHAGLKGGLEVTKRSAKAEQEWGVSRQRHPGDRPPLETARSQAGIPARQSPATCWGSVRDERAAQPMARRGRRAGCAELTHLAPGPRTGSGPGSGRPPGPARSREAAAASGPGPLSAALRPAPCSHLPHRLRPGTDHAPTGPRFYPRARAPRSGAGPTPRESAAPAAKSTVNIRIRGDPQYEALTHFSQ